MATLDDVLAMLSGMKAETAKDREANEARFAAIEATQGFRSTTPSSDEPSSENPASDDAASRKKKKRKQAKSKATHDKPYTPSNDGPSKAKSNAAQKTKSDEASAKAHARYSEIFGDAYQESDLRRVPAANGKTWHMVPLLTPPVTDGSMYTLSQWHKVWSTATTATMSMQLVYNRLGDSEMALIVSGKSNLECLLRFGKFVDALDNGLPLKETRLKEITAYLAQHEPNSTKFTLKTVVKAIAEVQSREDDGDNGRPRKRVRVSNDVVWIPEDPRHESPA